MLKSRFRLGFPNLFKRENYIRRKRNFTNMTPDELVLLQNVNRKAHKKMFYSGICFFSLAFTFMYLKRSYITKMFISYTVS